MSSSPNRLAKETSPYLLQHAHNPVDWYPWGEEAFQKATEEDKPVLVSIGYAACHWCHVMERESFEDASVAKLMNEHFVNIKVDREERPDVDMIYMDAVQAISGSGGWPLNVFLTPDRKPFYGGTYYPPVKAFNRASWRDVLTAISAAYHEKRDEILTQAETLTEHIKRSNSFGQGGDNLMAKSEEIDIAYEHVMKTADKVWGGFGRAPKFPQMAVIKFLLRYHHISGNSEALEQALLSLDKMSRGGIYDHIGGGFARYSTDTEWLVPHFEKMLYDNALIVSTLCEAYLITGKNEYKITIEETLAFVERELTHLDGGFYSALDADSEGVEGKFYVWSYPEVVETLGSEHVAFFCKYYDISEKGNWEGKNIPWNPKNLKEVIEDVQITEKEAFDIIRDGKEKLLKKRSERVRPGLDDKILLGWNALMNTAFSKAYSVTGNEHYKDVALRNMRFLLDHFTEEDKVFHTWKDGKSKYPAFLDDYAYLVEALLELAEITGDREWLMEAYRKTEIVLKHFSDEDNPMLFYTPDYQRDILLRKKEIYDGATPSGNAVMAVNLHRLSILFDKPEWGKMAEKMAESIASVTIKYPTSFGVWLSLIHELVSGTNEIALVGEEAEKILPDILRIYIPYRVFMTSTKSDAGFPLIADKNFKGKTLIFLCRNYACQKPVETVKELETLINQNNYKPEQ